MCFAQKKNPCQSFFFFLLVEYFCVDLNTFFYLKEMYDTECKNHNRFLQWHLKTENKNNLKPKKATSVLLKDNTLREKIIN